MSIITSGGAGGIVLALVGGTVAGQKAYTGNANTKAHLKKL